MTTGSLRLRLLLAGAVSVVAALALSALGLTLLFERHVERRVESELQVHLSKLVAGLAPGADGKPVASRLPADPRFDLPLSGLYWQIETGTTVLRSRSLWDARLRLPPARNDGDGDGDGAAQRLRLDGPDGAELVAVVRNLALPQSLGGGTARVAVARNAADIAEASRAFAVDMMPYLALLAIFLTAAAYAQVAVGLRPLATLRTRLAAVREGREHRLGSQFPDEIKPLATELDDLLAARERQVEKARARAGDLAHGLKTPLQVLAGDVERLRAKGETAIAGEIEQVATAMRRHVDRELARARLAAGNREAAAVVAETVRHVVAVVSRTPDGGRLAWQVDVPAELVARIDADDLAEAVGNLVENAARHAGATIAVSARRAGGDVAITVRDDGPGIPDDQIEAALRRGTRMDSMGGGAGLGLAIVGDVAEAWGGRLDLRNGPDGFAAIFAVPARKSLIQVAR